MSPIKKKQLTNEDKQKIEEKLMEVFQDIFFNAENVMSAKYESDKISEKIRDFILEFAENPENSEVDLLIQAKDKGLELVENHELIFFQEKIDKSLKMRAFLIPGMKIDFTEDNASEKVTEDDLQSVDHELCISFKEGNLNEFVKLGNLLDIRATIAKSLASKKVSKENSKELIKNMGVFKDSLHTVIEVAKNVLES